MSTRLIFKSVAIIFIALFFPSMVYTQTHFSGFAGAAGNIEGSQESDTAQMTADTVFFGQLDLFGKFQLRAGATVHTKDLFSGEMLNDVPATFTLDELSATLRFPCTHVTRYLSLFMGEFESIGSDIFLQRHFGIQPKSSRISEAWLGIRNSSIYAFSGFGLAYTLELKTPQAFSAYVYMNERLNQKRINTDLRFGGVLPIASLDLSFGFGFPIAVGNSEGSSANQPMEFHAGATVLLGNKHSATLYLQAGITKLALNPQEGEKMLNLDDIYLLIEPRFTADSLNFHFALFNLPKDTVADLFFISNALGCNLAIFAENIHGGIFNFTIGTHITVSARDSSLDKFNEITPRNLSLKLSPFIETPLFRGTLMSRLSMDFMEIQELHKTIKFTLGYAAKL